MTRPGARSGSGLTVVVTGAGGLLGAELTRASWPPDTTVRPLTSAQLDITDQVAVARSMDELAPDVIINAAAYTRVDDAENHPDRARAVNTTAVGHLARAADDQGSLLVHFSTDYVFDGTLGRPHREDDPVRPIGVYGQTKADGEPLALTPARALVLRVSWLYGALGPNFVATMLRLGAERKELAVVADQLGTPTATGDLARAVVELVTPTGDRVRADGLPRRLYHLASPTAATWHELACAALARTVPPFTGTCAPLTTDQYPTRAPRPADSRLDSGALAADAGLSLPPWSASLPSVVAELGQRAPAPVGAGGG